MVQTCKNCSYPTDNKFCPQCGQKTAVSRFTMKQLLHDFIHGFFHVDHGILYTARELILRPGRTLRNYLHGHRIGLFNPFTYILLLGGISAVFLKQFHWQGLFVDLGLMTKKAIDTAMWNSSIKHFSLRLLIAIPLYAAISWLFYYRKGYNFSEHLIVNTYLRGQGSLFMLLLAPIVFWIHGPVVVLDIKLGFYAGVLMYIAWAYAGLFNEKITVPALLKGLLCAFLASLLELFLLNLLIKK